LRQFQYDLQKRFENKENKLNNKEKVYI